MNPVLFLMIPIGALCMAGGIFLGRWQIQSRPEQAGLIHRDPQRQDQSLILRIVNRLDELRSEEDRLTTKMFLAKERIDARDIAASTRPAPASNDGPGLNPRDESL